MSSSTSPSSPVDGVGIFEERQVDPASDASIHGRCGRVRGMLIKCMVQTQCMQAGHTLPECLALEEYRQDVMPCQKMRQAYFECRRSLIDMRYRFRGPKASG